MSIFSVAYRVEQSPPSNKLSDWLDAKRVCTILHIKPRTLQTLRENGKLPYSKIGKKIYYHRDDIMKLVGKQVVETNIN